MTDEQTSDFFLAPDTTTTENAFAAPPDTNPVVEDFDYNFDTGDEQSPQYEVPPEENPVLIMEPVPVTEEDEPLENTPIIIAPPPPPTAAVLVEDVAGVEEDTTNAVVPMKSAMAAFNEEFQETLKQRKEEENAVKAAALEQAEADLALIAQQRESKREAKMSKNRAEEQSKLEAMEADLENDNSWQKVVKLVDLTQDGRYSAEDTKRMRDVFIVLKNDVNKADQLS
mmetsp:Transcript_3628/g.4937  ORF Transcript_3628/g.4937 Transcript_3628/m.4937 type:complete len:227 (-) Transcript_3628:108-788(-)